MGKSHPRHVVCVDCGKPPAEGARLNRKGRCLTCAWQAVMDNAYQLHDKAGPMYDKWRRAVKRAARRL